MFSFFDGEIFLMCPYIYVVILGMGTKYSATCNKNINKTLIETFPGIDTLIDRGSGSEVVLY